jgi:hypothetical protein
LKSILHVVVLLGVGFFVSRQPVRAQEVDAFIGLGTAHVSSNGRQIDTFGDGTLQPTSGMGGVFTNFGANLFFNRQLGVGWTGAWKFSSADYAGLQYNASFQTLMPSTSQLASVPSASGRKYARASDGRTCSSTSTTSLPAIRFPGVRVHTIFWSIWRELRGSMSVTTSLCGRRSRSTMCTTSSHSGATGCPGFR